MEGSVRANLANAITLSRILLAPLAWLAADHALLFAGLWLLCGLTDVADGLVARALATESDFGARLDSIADIVMFGVILLVMIGALSSDPIVLGSIVLVAVIRIANLGIAAARFKRFASIHTWANKAAGLLLFFTPLGFALLSGTAWVWAVVGVAVVAALEETAILWFGRDLTLNARWIGDVFFSA